MAKKKFTDEIYPGCYATSIHGYEVIMHSGKEKDCIIEHGRFSGTLETLLQYGLLTQEYDYEESVPPHVVSKIKEWAEAHGY